MLVTCHGFASYVYNHILDYDSSCFFAQNPIHLYDTFASLMRFSVLTAQPVSVPLAYYMADQKHAFFYTLMALWELLESTQKTFPQKLWKWLKEIVQYIFCPYLSCWTGGGWKKAGAVCLPSGRSCPWTKLGEGTVWATGGRKVGVIHMPLQTRSCANKNTILFPKKFKVLCKH